MTLREQFHPPPGHRLAYGSALVVVVLAVLVWLVVRYVSPSPPRFLVMSTGVTDGAYHQFGLRYQEILRANGIALQLMPSSGGVENIRRLNDGTVSVAFVQGGTGVLATDPGASPESTPLRSLATVAYEPVWIFTHTLDLSRGLGALAGKRIAVGVADSGNLHVAHQLLASYGVLPNARGTTFVLEGGPAAAQMLIEHQVDAAIMIVASQAAAVQALLANDRIRLASLDQVEGLAQRYPYFKAITLRRGAVDVARDLPSSDIHLLATTANLVVRKDVHPALDYLLLEAAKQVHSQASLLHRPGEFPSPRETDYPLSDEAEHYFKNGRPFLQNYLPFWAAIYVQRLLLWLLPLGALLLPLARAVPSPSHWWREGRLYRRYGELKYLERDLDQRQLDAAERDVMHAQLDRIEREIMHTKFPLDFSDRVYTLRQHVDYVRAQLDRQADPAGPDTAGQESVSHVR